MHVDAVLVLRRLVGEIVCEAEHAGELVPGLRIEIGVAAAGVDRPVTDADVRQARRIVGPDRDVAGDIGHVIVNAVVPAQRCDRQEISKAGHRVADAVEREDWNVPSGVANAPETVPAKDVSTRPYVPMAPTVSCPPNTGVAKV